jgi:signal transduction histidine kinase
MKEENSFIPKFVHGLLHDLSTPLSTLLLLVDSLMENAKLQSAQSPSAASTQQLARLEIAAGHLAKMSNLIQTGREFLTDRETS